MTPDKTCDLVAERFALGEPLAELTEHAESCPACKAMRATATAVADTTKSEIDPGMGFSARMTVATQKRIAERKRNRIVGGVAGGIVAAAAGVFIVTRGPGDLPDRPQPAVATPEHQDKLTDPTSETDAIRALARFRDVDTNEHLSARWGRIERPLAPYRALVKGQKQ